MAFNIGAIVCIAIICSMDLAWLLALAAIMDVIVIALLAIFYDRNSYYYSARILAEKCLELLCLLVLATTVGCFIFYDNLGFHILIMAAMLIYFYVYNTHVAAEREKATGKILMQLVSSVKQYSAYAYDVSYYLETEEKYGTSTTYINTRVCLDPCEDFEAWPVEKLFPGTTSALERFFSYAKVNYPGQVSGSPKYVIISFPQNT